MPASRLPYVHLCCAPVESTYTEAAFPHAAREGHLPLGHGGIDPSRILARLPAAAPFALEVPMTGRRAGIGAEALARHVREMITQCPDGHAHRADALPAR